MASTGSPGYLSNANTTEVLTPWQTTGAAGAAAAVTMAATAGVRHQPIFIDVGYDTQPAASSTLTVAWVQGGDAKTWVHYMGLIAGSQPINLPFGLAGDVNTAMSFTLSAGGGAVVANVFVLSGGNN
jgi:hypothetical protein